MASLRVIRRWHFREHLSIREICRRTGLSLNTIRKYLRLDGVEPKFKVPERPSKLATGGRIGIGSLQRCEPGATNRN
jgi:DNA-binding transcriptional MerR regulator